MYLLYRHCTASCQTKSSAGKQIRHATQTLTTIFNSQTHRCHEIRRPISRRNSTVRAERQLPLDAHWTLPHPSATTLGRIARRRRPLLIGAFTCSSCRPTMIGSITTFPYFRHQLASHNSPRSWLPANLFRSFVYCCFSCPSNPFVRFHPGSCRI